MHNILKLMKFAFTLASWACTALFWFAFAFWEVVTLGRDWHAARRSAPDGKLVCPAGHIIESTGVFQCSCGWVFRDDNYGLNCPNFECEKPRSNIVTCTTCGLSVRNPGRIGRLP